MNQEEEVLGQIFSICDTLDLPYPQDGRKSLPSKPDGAKFKQRDPLQIKGMVWHQALSNGTVEGVAKYHIGGYGPNQFDELPEGISYTWAIRKNGQIVLCHDFSKSPWSQGFSGRPGDENKEFMSVMFMGLFRAEELEGDRPTQHQLLAGLVLWSICAQEWRWNSQDLYGHFMLGKTHCPGDSLKSIVLDVRSNLPEQSRKIDAPSFDLSTYKGRQEALIHLGFLKDTADGIWGPSSRGALQRFQGAHQLVADGMWGPNTQRKLEEVLNS